MLMYNLIMYRKNYKKAIDSMWNYYRDEPIDPITDSESFKYKTSITGNHLLIVTEIEFAVPLKNLSSFWKTLVMSLSNCEINLMLTWSEDCVIIDAVTQAAGTKSKLPEIIAPTDAVVTLPTQEDNKLLQQLKTGLK